MLVKYTQDQVKNIFANSGCELLSQYCGAREPVQYCCSCSTISFIALSKFLQGQRCRSCRNIKIGDDKRRPQEYVEQYFKDQGCVLLSLYINGKRKLKYRCSCGNLTYTTFENFRRGHRCMYCGSIKTGIAQSGEKHWNWNPDREQVHQHKKIREQQIRLLWGCLHRLGTRKEGHTDELLGYSALELDNHLRSFSIFASLAVAGTFTIDHIFPVKVFLDHGIVDPKIICALDNLQPLSKSENCEKNDWYLEEEFVAYCQNHNISLLQEAV